MANIIGDIILDFQTTDPDNDVKITHDVLAEAEKAFNLPLGSFELGNAKPLSMGWSMAKLFVSLELAQKLYDNNSYQIENTKARSRSEKFLSWINMQFTQKGCKAQLKYAEDMKNGSGGFKYSSQFVNIFSDEFNWSR